MDEQLVADTLTSDSDEISDLTANLPILNGFIDLARQIDALPETSSRFYEESRSLFQTTAIGQDMASLENLLSNFFGQAVKPSGKSLPRKLRKSSVVKYLGGIQKDQALFLVNLRTGSFYGALWPWRRNKSKIEIHLGYCSDWMTDEDYQQLENLVHQSISHSVFEQMDATIGGQIHGISLPSFLQMAEMEKSTFTLRVTSRHRIGALHLSDGELIAAEFDALIGTAAAYRIISWDDVSIDIEPFSTVKTNEIKQPLMHVLMESLKMKDEADALQETPPPLPKGRPQPKAKKKKRELQRKRLVQLERAPEPRIRKARLPLMTLAAIGIGVFAVIALIVVATFHYLDNRRMSDGFQELLASIEKTEQFEQQLKLYQSYLESNPGTVHAKLIMLHITDIKQKIEDRDFDQTMLKVSALPVNEHYESKAIALFTEFLGNYPNSRHTEAINNSISEIKNLLDQYYYEELVRAARLDFTKRLEVYKQYLQQFPDGSYRQDVEILINEMGEKYLAYLQDEAKTCEARRRWEPCIEHSEKFISAYQGLDLSQKAIALKAQLMDKRDYLQLRSDANNAGTDYQKAYRLYRDYLRDHPQSTQKEAIEKEIAALGQQLKAQQNWLGVKAFATNTNKGVYERIQKLDQYLRKNLSSAYASDARDLMDRLERERQESLRQNQILAQRRAEQARIERERKERDENNRRILALTSALEKQLRSSTRYAVKGDGTFTDRTTGLTWTLLDSWQELGGCITFADAQAYVRRLRTGGYADWRMPSASELAAIHKQSPFFPSSGAPWYWSSEAYVKGFHSVANVVTSKQETIYRSENRLQSECGSVRVVRNSRP
jgi:hypothetical protein